MLFRSLQNQLGNANVTLSVSDLTNIVNSTFNVTIINNNMIYVGVKLEYGNSLRNLKATNIMIGAFTNNPPLFFRTSTILTNRPF